MKDTFWRNCNPDCSYYNLDKNRICGLDNYLDAPTLKCMLAHLCMLLRRFEIEREKIGKDGDEWKE